MARFGVIDGDVLVSGEDDAARLIPGRGVDVSSAGVIGPTFILTSEMRGSDWLYYNRCILDQLPGACGEDEPKTVEKKDEPKSPKPPPEPEPPAETTSVPASAPDGTRTREGRRRTRNRRLSSATGVATARAFGASGQPPLRQSGGRDAVRRAGEPGKPAGPGALGAAEGDQASRSGALSGSIRSPGDRRAAA